MVNAQAKLHELSATAEDLADFLERACKLLDLSFRQASLQAGLSHGTIWSIISNKVKHGDPDTIASLAVFFKVPEVNLLRLAGHTPKHISPTHLLENAEDVYQSLTDEEKEDWIRYGRLLLRARKPKLEDTLP
jgi:transcriptional regulator with XRE-family HTH domain